MSSAGTQGSTDPHLGLSAVSCSAPRPAVDLHPAAPLGGDGNLGPPAGRTLLACEERTKKISWHFFNKTKTLIFFLLINCIWVL